MYHPAAFCIAQIVADLPVLLFQVSHFSIVLYFMVGLSRDAGSFFTYWIVCFATCMAMTALFRAIGAISATFDAASKSSHTPLSMIATTANSRQYPVSSSQLLLCIQVT